MRLLHTSDWHLGRLFHQVHLTDDQAHVLRQVIDLARDAKVDAVIVAGDVYDRAVPPPEAVRLLDDVLAALLLEVKVPVILAAGNHDSPERLAFGSRLMSAQGLHLFGLPARNPAPVVLADAHGAVSFYVVPYAEPALVRAELGDPSAVDHDSAIEVLISTMLAAHPPQGRAVFVGHAFVQGGTGSDSERPLSVGGAGTVDASRFDRFCYAALGHLHRPQQVANERIRYAGALLKYSSDEIGQDRSVSIVDIDADGRCRVEHVALRPRRELRRIEGSLGDLLRSGTSDDYIVARLTDAFPVLDPIGKLRQFYPNVLCIERTPAFYQGGELQPSIDRRRLEHDQLFAGFFREMTGEAAGEDLLEVFQSAAASVSGRDRETSS